MLEQRLHNRRPGALAGIGVVALIALAAAAGSAFFYRLLPRLGALASVGFIAYGCAIAWLVLDRYALEYVYAANADCLRVCRAYGKRERFLLDVWLNQVVAWGEPDALKQRFPDARVRRATREQCPFEPLALAYRSDGKVSILVLQPDETMRAHLIAAIREKKG